jgi:hypothetical protein
VRLKVALRSVDVRTPPLDVVGTPLSAGPFDRVRVGILPLGGCVGWDCGCIRGFQTLAGLFPEFVGPEGVEEWLRHTPKASVATVAPTKGRDEPAELD